MKAGSMFNRAAKTYRAIGATKSADYLTTLHNLSLAYEERKMYDRCHKIYHTIFSLYDENSMDATGSFRLLISDSKVRTMLADADKFFQLVYCPDELVDWAILPSALYGSDDLINVYLDSSKYECILIEKNIGGMANDIWLYNFGPRDKVSYVVLYKRIK